MQNNGADITLLLCLKATGWSKRNLGKYLLQHIFSKCGFNFFCCEICDKKVYWTNLFICATETICGTCLEPKLNEKYFAYYDVSLSHYVEIYYGRIIITFLRETFKICSIIFYKNRPAFLGIYPPPSLAFGEREKGKREKGNKKNSYIKKNRLTLTDKFLLHHFDQYKKIMCGCKAVCEYVHSKILN